MPVENNQSIEDDLRVYDEADSKVAKSIEDYEKKAAAQRGKIETEARKEFARIVLITFSGIIVVITVATIFKPWSEWKDPAEFLASMLSSIMLPVVTLVVGYFYGKEK